MKQEKTHIGGQLWRIRFVKGNSPHLQADPDECVYGITYADKCLIYISLDAAPEVQADAVIHEKFGHAAFAVAGVDAILAEVCESRDVAVKTEERIIRALVPVYHRMFIDSGFKILP